MTQLTGDEAESAEYDVLVVGAGLGGLHVLHTLRAQGCRVRVLEAADDVGGTWYHNRYPGARCDIESLDYSYSFGDVQQDWHWTERYASQPEILRYVHYVADRYDLRGDIDLSTRVDSAVFDEQGSKWHLTTETGKHYVASACVMATGTLSAPQLPDIAGVPSFEGEWFHTADWPHETVSFKGKTVGIVGTGSSGVQLIPKIAAEADRLLVFQRTANYVVPAQNRPLGSEEERSWKENYPERRLRARNSRAGQSQMPNERLARDMSREDRRAELERRWELGGMNMLMVFKDELTDASANLEVSEFVAAKIAEVVNDPATASLLTPRDLYIGTKRLCVGNRYYETFNEPHVELVDVSNGIDGITKNSVIVGGRECRVDTLVFATGFDAFTGALLAIDIRGRGGVALAEHWQDGPKTTLGLMTSGFPNMFFVAGAGSPSVLASVITLIEVHSEWIANALDWLRTNGHSTLESSTDQDRRWTNELLAAADATLYTKSLTTWYTGANTPGKARVFMPYVRGLASYTRRLTAASTDDFSGFLTR